MEVSKEDLKQLLWNSVVDTDDRQPTFAYVLNLNMLCEKYGFTKVYDIHHKDGVMVGFTPKCEWVG
jgi:hypothetical protein